MIIIICEFGTQKWSINLSKIPISPKNTVIHCNVFNLIKCVTDVIYGLPQNCEFIIVYN